MIDLRPNIIGYHTNIDKKILSCLSNGNLIIFKDTFWLGRGMYFWDNLGNANYWKYEKIRKGEGTVLDIKIIQANIFVDNILDLTDSQNLEFIDKLWERFVKNNIKEKIPKEHLGKRLDYLFESFPEYFSYGVIKALGVYKYVSTNTFFKETNISVKSKLIYSVKKKDYIANFKLYEEE